MRILLITSLIFITADAFAANVENGKTAFAQRCASCHGAEGKGDGVVGKSLPPGLMPDLTTGPFKFANDVEKVKELITKGGAALRLSPMMPAAPSIAADELADIASFVMSIRK